MTIMAGRHTTRAALWYLALVIGGAQGLAQRVGAQTPEQAKLWEEQRAQAQAEAKVRAERAAQLREQRRADPMSWARTLNPMTAGGWQSRHRADEWSPRIRGWKSFYAIHEYRGLNHEQSRH